MTQRSPGRPYERLKKMLRAEWAAIGARCALCGQPIDYSIRSPHRLAITVDHIVPRWAGGKILDPNNCQPAHHSCNASRGASEGNRIRARRPTRHTSTTW